MTVGIEIAKNCTEMLMHDVMPKSAPEEEQTSSLQQKGPFWAEKLQPSPTCSKNPRVHAKPYGTALPGNLAENNKLACRSGPSGRPARFPMPCLLQDW